MLANVTGHALGGWGFFLFGGLHVLSWKQIWLDDRRVLGGWVFFSWYILSYLEDTQGQHVINVRWVDEKGRLSRGESPLGGEAFQLRAKELLWDIGLIFVTTIICECTKLMYLPNFLHIQHLYCEQLRAKELLLDIALIFESQKFTYSSIFLHVWHLCFKGRFPCIGLQMNFYFSWKTLHTCTI